MKLVIYKQDVNVCNAIDLIKHLAVSCIKWTTDYPEILKQFSDIKYIILLRWISKHNKYIYIFDRFNPDFIQAIENADFMHPFVVEEIDDRFNDPRYYKINQTVATHMNDRIETLEIKKDQIINDLYETNKECCDFITQRKTHYRKY